MSGFITLHREAIEHPLFAGDSARFGAWVWMVARACWKPTAFDLHGAIVTLQRGQFVASRSQMAKAWGWSESAVERFLTRLKTEQMIERATGQGRSVITICNYAKYQDGSEEPGQATEQATGQRPDSDRTAKEQGNKETREEEPNGSPSHSARDEREAAVDLLGNSAPRQRKALPNAKFAMTPDWRPAPLPASVQVLVDDWPPGRFEREIEQFRDYWIDRGEKRAGWDRTFHNRIRDIHDRVIRDNRNGTYHGNQNSGFAPAGHRAVGARVDGFTAAIDDMLEQAEFRYAARPS